MNIPVRLEHTERIVEVIVHAKMGVIVIMSQENVSVCQVGLAKIVLYLVNEADLE